MQTKSIVKKQKNKIDEATSKRDIEIIASDARQSKAEKMLYSGNVTRIVPRELVYFVESESKPDTKYKVILKDLNEFSCECPDYHIQSEKNPKHQCKHIKLVILSETYSMVKQSLGEPQYDF